MLLGEVTGIGGIGLTHGSLNAVEWNLLNRYWCRFESFSTSQTSSEIETETSIAIVAEDDDITVREVLMF
ncbi:MAG: hypothetical protein BRC57_13715 [Cyanobacteria bacterium QS_8_48_54]|nr:MAG: hypothetical protein BRC57_13715 [Cyanobacteria bacterium QS_8_48_54]